MWTKQNMPDQAGKTAIVTGANTGIGYETALALYEAGATVIVACRDAAKAEAAIAKMKTAGGSGQLEAGILNLSNLAAVEAFANTFLAGHQQLHLLINNAGVMMPPAGKTDDGYELQFGTNFIGHFALTGLLYPLLRQTPGARVVNVSSGAHKWAAAIDYENLRLEKAYEARQTYGVSKLANLLHTLELQRRATQNGDTLLSVAAHPGVTYTDLQRHLDKDFLTEAFKQYKEVMEPWQGALPSLYAATAPAVQGGSYYGPDGENELAGYPAPAAWSEAARNPEQARLLWDYAESATGVHYPGKAH